MGQKVNPISLRLETTNRGFDSCYYNHTHSTQLFVENLKLQLYFNNFLKQTGFSQGRVLISTFFRGCETNLFYFNPLYSRENKGKRFMIKSFHIGSGKEKERHSFESKESFKNSFFQKNNSKERSFFPFSSALVSEKIVSNSFLNSTFPSNNFFSVKENSVDCPQRETGRYGGRKETFSKRPDNGLFFSFGFPFLSKFQSDISKQLSFLVYFYQLVEKKRFFVKSNNIVPKPQKDTVFREEKPEIDGEGKTNLDPFRGKMKKPFLKENPLRKDKERSKCFFSKEYPLSFPSVPTLSAFLFIFSFGLNSEKNKDLAALQEKKEREKGNFAILPSPQEKRQLQPGRRSSLFYPLEKAFLPFSNFLMKREEKEVNSHYLEQRLFRDTGSVFYLSFLRALNSTQSALFLCQEIVYYLEKRVSFQRIKTVLLEELSRDNRIKGIRVTCSGRAGGKSKRAQRSKMETFKNGQTSLGVFSSKIDFHCENGLTGFGLVGVKVWICYP